MSDYVMPDLKNSEYIGPDNFITPLAAVPTAPRHTPLANLQPDYRTGQAPIKFRYLRDGKIKSFINGRVDMHVAKEVEAKIGLLQRRWSQHAQLLRYQGVARLKEADRVFEKWRNELKAVEAQYLTNEVEEIRVENQDLNAEKQDLEDEKKYLIKERQELRELTTKLRHENRRLRRSVHQAEGKLNESHESHDRAAAWQVQMEFQTAVRAGFRQWFQDGIQDLRDMDWENR